MSDDDSLAPFFDAVATYDLIKDFPPVLEEASRVFHHLAGAEKEKFFLHKLETLLPNSAKGDARIANTVKVFSDQHPMGYRLTLIQANHNGEPVIMPVIEDRVLERMLVVGPASHATRFAAASTGKIDFVPVSDRSAGSQVDMFILQGLQAREVSGMPSSDGANGNNTGMDVPETLINALSMITHLAAAIPEAKSGVLPASTTVGQVVVSVANGEAPASIYAVAAKGFHDMKMIRGLLNGCEEAVTVKPPLRYKAHVSI
ncbi:MAG: hypothetical protein ACAH83_17895 [Alphaproteobacteria bacterium]